MIRRTVSGIAVKYIAFLQSKEKYFSCSAVVWVLFSMAYGKMANSFPQQSDRPVHWEAHNYYFLIFFFLCQLSETFPSAITTCLWIVVTVFISRIDKTQITWMTTEKDPDVTSSMLLHGVISHVLLDLVSLLLTSSVLALGRSMGLCQGKAEHGGQKEGKRKWAVTLYIPTTHCKVSLFRA